ncbi:FKBP-type peptidyl-prolyl cis-trans isomerase [Pantoea stewartii]|uniref:FKBP-type peptidyl-prolyl cis-trans isomerase n=1 Tax=Pantoea stewartii TaxID=66269 RepID=UPI000736E0D4|nr:FKBP-type peptidyl-prolyl cis-trans isomerase [Pantoea stewartii]KTS25278.1 hypothetical protein NS381_21410 [Pantoea stewartii]
MMYSKKKFKLKQIILTCTLFSPPSVLLADEPPREILFAQKWISKNNKNESNSKKLDRTHEINIKKIKKDYNRNNHISHKSSQDLNNREVIKATPHIAETLTSQYNIIAKELDSCKIKMNEIKKNEELKNKECTVHSATQNEIRLKELLQHSYASKGVLESKYKKLKNLVDSLRISDDAIQKKVKNLQEENTRLKLESKINTLQADISYAQSTTYQKSLSENYQSHKWKVKEEKIEAAVNNSATQCKDFNALKHENDLVKKKLISSSSLDVGESSILKEPCKYVKRLSSDSDNLSLTSERKEQAAQLSGDYAAGVAVGREALAALDMNRMLGVETHMQSFYQGVTDALRHNVKFKSQDLISAQLRLSNKINLARDTMIKLQRKLGKKALSLFRQDSTAIRARQGYWYKIVGSNGQPLSPEKEINVSMTSSIAGGGVIEHKKMLVKNTGEFPSLFRSVIEKLGKHGTATFFVPPELAYGDEGLLPSIPPGASLIYEVSIDQSQNTALGGKLDLSETSKKYLNEFMQRKGVKKSNDGFLYQIEEEGKGKTLSSDDMVTTVMRESIAGGKIINDMVEDNQAIILKLDRYPPLFQKALKLLKDKGAIRIVVPSRIAYGDGNLPNGIDADALLIYDIRILAVKNESYQ